MENRVPGSGFLGGRWVQGWRVMTQGDGASSGAVDYLEFQLAAPAEHRVESIPGRLIVRVRPKDRTLLPPTGALPDPPRRPATPSSSPP